MSLKAELETWASALKAYDENDYEKALDLFARIADSSKILTNMGLIYATLGEHELAVEQFIAATGLDQYLAVAYFQCGVSNFLLTRYELAYKDFEEALLYLRGNENINYEQLGLKFKLYSAEVLFNKGLSQIYMGNGPAGLGDMEEARREKVTAEHSVIDDAIADRGEGYTVFSIPVGVLYRPPESKLKNVKTKDYLGKAKLIAAADAADAYTTFTGVTRLKQGITPTGTYLDNPGLARSATEPPPRIPLKSDDSFNDGPGPGAGGGLGRAKTTLNVPADREARIAGGAAGGPGLGRNNSFGMGPRAGAPASAPAAGPTRGLSVRKPQPPPPQQQQQQQAQQGGRQPDRELAARIDRLALDDGAASPEPAASPPVAGAGGKKGGNGRLTEFYDDMLGAYGNDDEDVPPLPPVPPNPDRVAAWAARDAQPGRAPTNASARGPPSRGPPSSYAPSSYGGQSVRRKLTRRPTRSTPSSRAPSGYGAYEEEEEGYGSGGEYEEAMYELVKIRVKLHYAEDVRGMALTPETPFDEFMDKVEAKFGRRLALKFKDEDGGRVTLQDDSDYELAIETARESARGKPEGKLEIWCSDA